MLSPATKTLHRMPVAYRSPCASPSHHSAVACQSLVHCIQITGSVPSLELWGEQWKVNVNVGLLQSSKWVKCILTQMSAVCVASHFDFIAEICIIKLRGVVKET